MSDLYLTIDDIKYSTTIILMPVKLQNKSQKSQETLSVSENRVFDFTPPYSRALISDNSCPPATSLYI